MGAVIPVRTRITDRARNRKCRRRHGSQVRIRSRAIYQRRATLVRSIALVDRRWRKRWWNIGVDIQCVSGDGRKWVIAASEGCGSGIRTLLTLDPDVPWPTGALR